VSNRIHHAAAVERLSATEARRIEVASPDGPVAMATVRDPDGVLVELIGPPRSKPDD
jgi:hypothetical protein